MKHGLIKCCVLFCLLLFISEWAFPQQKAAATDTTRIYKNIESYSKRTKFTTFMYGLIFKPYTKVLKRNKNYKKLIQKPYSRFEGKIIRKINIETLDPFGYSIGDSLVAKQTTFSKAENKLHIKTRHITIRNLLLIHQNQVFDSLLVKESERLVRKRGYVQDVSFFVKASSGKSDSVDIFIRVLDNWSITPEVLVSTSSNTVILTEKNFVGTGHEFRTSYSNDFTNGINDFSTNYFIPNIRNTYINTNLHYEIDGYKNIHKSLAFDRPFFSPLARWAGGVSFASNSTYFPLNLNFRAQDYWGGYAHRLFKNNTVKARTTNLITTTRYLRVHYLVKPTEQYDPQNHYSSENFYLAGIGLSTRNYVQDKYVFKFGMTEDVPIGRVYALTGGYQIKGNSKRLFAGARFSVGNYYSWGYLSGNLEYETFINESKTEQGIMTAGMNYFTGLFEIGKWKFRQFVKPQVTLGLDRFAYDSLTLNDTFGLDGFTSKTLSGTSRLLLTLQTQAYAPWHFIGFRFGPFLTCSLGVLGDAKSGFRNKKVYSQIGLGILIKNENLIINTFQFSISFYPVIPGNGNNILKTNAFETTDFGFSDFEIGKPSTKAFQ